MSATPAHAQTSEYYANSKDGRPDQPYPDLFPDTAALTGDAGVQQACAAALNALGQYYSGELSLDDVLSSRSALPDVTPQGLRRFLGAQEQMLAGGLSGRAQTSLCNALAGGNLLPDGSLDGGGMLESMGEQGAVSLLGFGTGWLQESGLPFTARLETEAGFRNGDPYWEVLTVQPLWQDAAAQNFVFTQLSYNRSFDTEGQRGADARDTVNLGLAARHLLPGDTVLLGANAFFDHNFDYNHNRASIGADVQTSLLGASFNRYLPLTRWKSVDALTEERAVAGWDMELRGQLPSLPAWTAYAKGYQWDGLDAVDDTYGAETRLEYAPVRGMRVTAGMAKDNDSSLDAQVGVRLVYRFGESLDDLLAPVTELVSVKERVYDKVWRDNTIRVQQRQKASAQLTVTTSFGANSHSGPAGAGALAAGMRLDMPVSVTTQNAGGALAVLRLADGGTLTLGQGTTVNIAPGLLTLVTGTVQYVSGATNVVVNIPGGTITLLGTDIDVVSDGTNSTVRVRDGSIRVEGSASGVVAASAGSGAAVNAGAASALGAAALQTHGETVSAQIDRVAPQHTEAKAAPYPHQAPEIVAAGDAVGDTIKIGVTYSKAVAVGGTPQLALTINGNARVAAFSAVDSTAQRLVFAYTLVAGDAGATALTTHSIDPNGGTLTGGGKLAVTTMADTVLVLDAVNDNTPDNFTFTDVANQAWNATILSNIVTIDGIGPAAVPVSISGAGTPEYSIDGGAWTDAPGLVTDGQTVQLRLISAQSSLGVNTATVTVGTLTRSWNVTSAEDLCAAPSPAPGVTCPADGTVFVGLSGGHKVFMTAADPVSSPMGRVVGENYCAALGDVDPNEPGAHGHSDWVLPPRAVVDMFYTNLQPPTGYGFRTDSYFHMYWASGNAENAGRGWARSVLTGVADTEPNTTTFSVRCVRIP